MRRIVFFVYPQFQLLDLAGVAAVFSGIEDAGVRPYQVISASALGGRVRTAADIAIATMPISQLFLNANDTVILPGADENARCSAATNADLITHVQSAAKLAERVAAVSTGSYLLADAGLLDGKQAVTHWACRTEFAAKFPRVFLLTDPLYVDDGGVWTSAGTTAGIDMALEMVKRDHGNAPAHSMARILRGRRARARLAGQGPAAVLRDG